MNRIILIGNLANDIELRNANNKVYTRFTIAVNSKDKTEFIRCIAWDKTATLLANHVLKGNKLGIEGHLTTSKYQNTKGDTSYITSVSVERIEFLTPKKKEQMPELTEEDIPW